MTYRVVESLPDTNAMIRARRGFRTNPFSVLKSVHLALCAHGYTLQREVYDTLPTQRTPQYNISLPLAVSGLFGAGSQI